MPCGRSLHASNDSTLKAIRQERKGESGLIVKQAGIDTIGNPEKPARAFRFAYIPAGWKSNRTEIDGCFVNGQLVQTVAKTTTA